MRVEPRSLAFDTESEQHLFVWPWIGVLANIPLHYSNARFRGPTATSLNQHLSNALCVRLLCTHRGHSGFALVHFDQGLKGLHHATLFDHHFRERRRGRRDWNDAVLASSPQDSLYGWVAREDDYRFAGIVGYHLRNEFRGFNGGGAFDVTKEEDAEQEEEEREMVHSRVAGFSLCLEDLIKQKDHIFQRYHQDMREAHHSAQKNLENIISQRAMVTVLLEAKKQEIEMRSAELAEGGVSNEAELGIIHKEKYMIEKATLEQRNGDNKLVLLAEKHKKQKENLHRQIIDFEKDIEDKHVLQLEIERMRGALRVMRHMVDAGDDDVDEDMAEKIEIIQEQLKEKEQEYIRLEAMNQTLCVNEESQGTVKELMKYLKEGSENKSTGIKRGGGDIDYKPFFNVAKRKCSEDNAREKSMGLYSEWNSEWNNYLQDPNWNPFVTIKEEIDINDESYEPNSAGGKKSALK